MGASGRRRGRPAARSRRRREALRSRAPALDGADRSAAATRIAARRRARLRTGQGRRSRRQLAQGRLEPLRGRLLPGGSGADLPAIGRGVRPRGRPSAPSNGPRPTKPPATCPRPSGTSPRPPTTWREWSRSTCDWPRRSTARTSDRPSERAKADEAAGNLPKAVWNLSEAAYYLEGVEQIYLRLAEAFDREGT